MAFAIRAENRARDRRHLSAIQKNFGGHEADLWNQSDDPHPNARGHRLMAEILAGAIKARNPLKLK